jgi:nicotinate-nucleotide adenylyltransferase
MRDRDTVRVGILGGTLDPIHVGHLETARAARRALALTQVLVMPARVPPHRVQGPSVSMFHRFAMAAMAIAGEPGATVSDAELTAAGPSYTASTLDRLTAEGLDRCRLFFIAGADAFAEIETWHRYPEVLDLAHFVVISRPGVAASSLAARLPHLAARFRQPGDTNGIGESPGVFLVDAATPDVSSSDIRRRLGAGMPITGLVPPPVEEHIRRHRLYAEHQHDGSIA